jgi:hypothetical protein
MYIWYRDIRVSYHFQDKSASYVTTDILRWLLSEGAAPAPQSRSLSSVYDYNDVAELANSSYLAYMDINSVTGLEITKNFVP